MSDLDDIEEIAANTWGGHDYLAHSFKKWLQDSNALTIGIIIDNKVASIANLRLIEEGQTGWMEGLRVHPKHRRKGLARTITNHIVKLALEKDVKRLRYTTASDNVESIHLAKSINMSVKFELGIFWNGKPKEVAWRSEGKVREASIGDFPDEFYASSLFPEGVLVHDWKAFDINQRVLSNLQGKSRFWIQKSNESITSFSIGGDRYEGDNLFWSIAIYSDDEASFLAQLSHHLDIASESYTGIFVVFPMEFKEKISGFEWVMDTHDRSEELLRMLFLERVL